MLRGSIQAASKAYSRHLGHVRRIIMSEASLTSTTALSLPRSGGTATMTAVRGIASVSTITSSMTASVIGAGTLSRARTQSMFKAMPAVASSTYSSSVVSSAVSSAASSSTTTSSSTSSSFSTSASTSTSTATPVPSDDDDPARGGPASSRSSSQSSTSSSSSSKSSSEPLVAEVVTGDEQPRLNLNRPSSTASASASSADSASSAASQQEGDSASSSNYEDAASGSSSGPYSFSGDTFEEQVRDYQRRMDAYDEQLLHSFGKNFARAVDVMRFCRMPTDSLVVKSLQYSALIKLMSFSQRKMRRMPPVRMLRGMSSRIEQKYFKSGEHAMIDSFSFESTPDLYDRFMGYYLTTPWQYRIGKRLLEMEPAKRMRWERIIRAIGRPFAYYSLTKPRVTLMVTVTAWWGYALMVPISTHSFTTVAALMLGTYMTGAAASIINQMRETDVDARMVRTASRPMVVGSITQQQAAVFAAILTVGGAAILSQLSWIAAALAVGNIALYGGLYTSLKRTTPLNTEIGAIVGAIPPIMGYFAALPPGAPWSFDLVAMLWPALIMFAWQMQHVMLICRMYHQDYNTSGLHMQCYKDPRLSTTTSKGIAWAWLCIPVVAFPMFAQWSELAHIVVIMGWALYAGFYTHTMLSTPLNVIPKFTLLGLGYLLLLGTIVLGFITQRTGRYDFVMFDLPGSQTRPVDPSRPYTHRERREIVAYKVSNDQDLLAQAKIAAAKAVQESAELAKRQ